MILVVDDDQRVVETMKIWLKDAGYEVKTASDGALAYNAAESPECECMVLDINMPNFNGPSLLLLLQAEERHVPVIVITGERGFSRKEMQQFANVVAFFEKPVEAREVVAAVGQHARTGRHHNAEVGTRHAEPGERTEEG